MPNRLFVNHALQIIEILRVEPGILCWKGCRAMNKGFLQTIAIVICAAGAIYTVIILQRDGTLQAMWDALTSGAFGGYPL